ncbi:MAG: hypothetical protein LBT83_02150 [Tannerella sp.]|jgi:uncharacterized protein YigE (DUF2233 family)|nr:hypothetical protein [Tannerella sp.]
MKKNFYNQKNPRFLSWGTMKRSAAAICLAAVMLLAPAVVHAVNINLASPGTAGTTVVSGATNVYTVPAAVNNYIQLTAADSTYVLYGTTTNYAIQVRANNITVVLAGASITFSGGSGGAGLHVPTGYTGTTLKIKSGASNLLRGTYGGIYVEDALTIENDAAVEVGAALSTYAGTSAAAISARANSTINIASGKIIISNSKYMTKTQRH